MGSKQTKIEGTYLPDTPKTNRIARQLKVQTFLLDGKDAVDDLDPRSPTGRRTPLEMLQKSQNLPTQKNLINIEAYTDEQASKNFVDNPLIMLRKRFCNKGSYNLNDPRSPQLNRTPLALDEAIDRSLNLDDTFADFESHVGGGRNDTDDELQMDAVETTTTEITTKITAVIEYETIHEDSFHSTQNTSSMLEVNDIAGIMDDDETLASPAVLQQTPVALLQQLDPRSPTYGVDRTPIIFTDDDEAGEEKMLEDILATLSLDMSSASNSIASFGSPRLTETSDAPPKPTNKHLSRVRAGHKIASKPRRFPRQQPIYIDENNDNSISAPTTPKPKSSKAKDDSPNRTPLSCVKNRSLLRSRSVEPFAKMSKTMLNLSGYDVDASFEGHVGNARMKQRSQDKMETFSLTNL